MKPHIVEDGELRLRESPEFRARLRDLRESIRGRRAREYKEAGFFRRLVLQWQMAAEFRRERRQIEPSPQALYSSQIVASHSENDKEVERGNDPRGKRAW